jgi:hypothetical protein
LVTAGLVPAVHAFRRIKSRSDAGRERLHRI